MTASDIAVTEVPTKHPSPLHPPQSETRKTRFPLFRLKIIDGYLLHHVVSATLQGFLWFAGLLLAVAVITSARKVVTDGLPLNLLLVLIGYEVPRIVLFTLPMSLLFATVQTFSDLSLHGELTAIQVAGASLPRLLWGPFMWAVVLTLASFALQEWAVPASEAHKDVGLLNAARSSIAALVTVFIVGCFLLWRKART